MASDPWDPTRELFEYFDSETALIEAACLTNIDTHAAWEGQRERRRIELLEMLGLWPMPERTPLDPVVTGRLEHPEFTVEKLHFQSLPGVYVTANLYLPNPGQKPAPVILYVSGHSHMRTNDVWLGNKTGYQHHGAWFARHGYACLTLDTLQLGEIPGDHHGTYRLGKWWWNSRGYTPAGVEAWAGIRALDYLESRPEIDMTRVGMTGRSGGGSYTWTTAAVDDRIHVAAPVAGITDVRNHVVDGVVEGHCDCMYFINTHRWDFALNAALIAPRPLLMVNTDADSIFPLDGVVRVHKKIQPIYKGYEKPENLGLVIAPGGHKDTQDIQVPVFRWFEKHLRGIENPVVTMPASPIFNPADLRAFDPGQEPVEARHSDVPLFFGNPTRPDFVLDAAQLPLGDWKEKLLSLSFAGWPQVVEEVPGRQPMGQLQDDGVRYEWALVEVQSHVRLPMMWAFADEVTRGNTPVPDVRFEVLDDTAWDSWRRNWGHRFPGLIASNGNGSDGRNGTDGGGAVESVRADIAAGRVIQVWFVPRGVGPASWKGDGRRQTHLKRRFQLLGQTVGGMRVFDTLRGMQAARHMTYGNETVGDGSHFTVVARGDMACHALYAAALSDDAGPGRLILSGLPMSHLSDGPDYLNVLQVTDIPEVLNLVRRTTDVTLLP
jgi:dienelactone hydrolase